MTSPRVSRTAPASDQWLVELATSAGLALPESDAAQPQPSAWSRLRAAGLSDAAIVKLACDGSGTGPADLANVGPTLAALLPESIAARYVVVPVGLHDATIDVATSNPLDSHLQHDLAFATGLRVRLLTAAPDAIAAARIAVYGAAADTDRRRTTAPFPLPAVPRAGLGLGARTTDHDESAKPEITLSTTELAERLLADALAQRCSDVHFEPQDGEILVRFRVDGALHDAYRVPADQSAGLVRRLKIVAGMDITDALRPQDGRASVSFDDRHVDLRVSTLPLGGMLEKVVVRVLDGRAVSVNLDDIGFSATELRRLQRLLDHPEGLVLVTGPTGSGKTTTLYAGLRSVQRRELNIITVEDPVEYRIAGITQVQINEKARMTFAASLRSILRQDPDVVLVGEIRDAETAEIAVKASMTGHLVLSTLHTADAVSTVDRLYGMDVDPAQLATALKGIVSQRLVRRLCGDCAAPVSLAELPPQQQQLLAGRNTKKLRRAVGCPKCRGSGYSGRTLVAEILVATAAMQRAIGRRASVGELREIGQESGLTTLWESGMERVLDGTTSLHELLDNVPAPLEAAVGESAGQAEVDALVAQLLGRGPAPAPAPTAGSPALGTGDAGRIAQVRVLVVDDDLRARRELATALAREGFGVIEAADGEAALSYARRLHPDVVLTEIALPRLDGVGLVQALASEGHACRVIVYTAQRDGELLAWLGALGAADVVERPIDLRILASRLRGSVANAA